MTKNRQGERAPLNTKSCQVQKVPYYLRHKNTLNKKEKLA